MNQFIFKKCCMFLLGASIVIITASCDSGADSPKQHADGVSKPAEIEGTTSRETSTSLKTPGYPNTEAGALEYFTQEFGQPVIQFDGVFPPHPRLLIDKAELRRAKERYAANEFPYAAISQSIISQADQALTTPIKGPIDSNDSLAIAGHAVHDSVMANNLALAYQLTDNEAYAKKAFEIIDAWIYAKPLAGSTWEFDVRGCPGMDYARTFVFLGSAWDLLANHPEATPKRQAALEEMLRYHAALMKIELKHWADNDYLGRQYFQNHMVASSFGILWIGSLLGDRDLVQYALDHVDNPRDWSELLNGMIYVEGQPKLELILGLEAPDPQTGEIVDRYRHHEAPGKGMPYAMLSLTLMTAIAELADHINVDLYSSQGVYGESLGDALDYYGQMLAARDLSLHGNYLADEAFLKNPSPFWASPFILASEHYPDNEGIQKLIESIDLDKVPNHIHYPNQWSVLIDSD